MTAQDKPKSKPATDEYRDNWDRIFKKAATEEGVERAANGLAELQKRAREKLNEEPK